MDKAERQAARARCEAATPADGTVLSNRDAWELYVHFLTDLPAALDECDRLEGEVERLRDALGIVERATHVSDDFPDDVNTHGKFGPMRRMAHDVAAAALEGGSDA